MTVKVTKENLVPIFGEGISIKDAQANVDKAVKQADDYLKAFVMANTEAKAEK